MTIQEIIAKVDELAPNQYSETQKIGWLSTLDGQIFHDVILQHAGGEFAMYPPEGYDTDEYELIIQPPYAEDVYVNYLLSRIAQQNSEIAKYNQFAALYNQAFKSWSGFYTRTHKPITRGRWRF